MKLISFKKYGETRVGAVTDDQKVIDLNYATQALFKNEGKYRYKKIAEAYVPSNMLELLQGGKESLDIAKKAVTYVLKHPDNYRAPFIYNQSEVNLLAPLPNPGKIVCVGHNYREHILEMGREIPTHPVIFSKFSNTIIGPEDDIPLYPISEELDYEGEFAFVVGKQAKNISENESLDYVAGYTIVNDVTYRDIQFRTIQWLQGKTVDGSAPMGPWIVTTDEITNPHELELVLTVNGEERQRSNTRNLVFNVNRLLSYLSTLFTLEPGDVVLTGTPAGVGFAHDPKKFLKDGDVVAITVDKIGTLKNKVVKQKGDK